MKKLFFLSLLALTTTSCSNPKSPENIKNSINKCIGKSNKLAVTEKVSIGKNNYWADSQELEKTKELAKKGIVEITDLGKNVYDVKIKPQFVNKTPNDGSIDDEIQARQGYAPNVKICDLKVEEVKNLKFWEEFGVKNVSVDAILVPVDANIKIEPITRTLTLEDDGNGGDYKFCKE